MAIHFLSKLNKKPLKTILILALLVAAGSIFMVWQNTRWQGRVIDETPGVVTITPEGFVPADLIVKPGTHVQWVNQDEVEHQVASNPYPEHTDLPDLFSPEPLLGGESYTYTFGSAGTYQYHDNLNPYINGTIQVVE